MGPQDLNPAAPTQVGTGADGQPIYEGSLNDQSSRPDDASTGGSPAEDDGSSQTDATPEDPVQNAGDESATAPVDTGNATFANMPAGDDLPPDVVPISGDSADDPNLGEAGDPAGVDTGDATFAGMSAADRLDLPPFDPGSGGGGPVAYPPSSDPGAGLPPPPLPAGFVIRDGHVVREVPPPPLDGGLPPPPLPKGFVIRDGQVQRVEDVAPQAAPSSRPGWVIPAVVAGVLVFGSVAFAATRGGSPAPAATTAPTASISAPTTVPTATVARTIAPTAAPAAARVTDSRIAQTGNVCLDRTTLSVTVQIEGANAGDVVVFALTGPGLPSTVSAALDAKGAATATMGVVGPVKGTQTWSAAVQSIGGTAVVNGPSQVFGFCPNN